MSRQAGAIEYFRYGIFPVECHHVNACDSRNGFDFGNDLTAQLQAFAGDAIRRHATKPADHRVWHIHARYLTLHVLERA
jgi:hypothetical protein